LPKNISNLIGEANQHYMFNEFDEAITKLNEIIRMYTDYPEPYHLLGLLHGKSRLKLPVGDHVNLRVKRNEVTRRKLLIAINWRLSAHRETLNCGRKLLSCIKRLNATNRLPMPTVVFWRAKVLTLIIWRRGRKFDLLKVSLRELNPKSWVLRDDWWLQEGRQVSREIDQYCSSRGSGCEEVCKSKKTFSHISWLYHNLFIKLYTKLNQTQRSVEILTNVLKIIDKRDYNIINMICEIFMKVDHDSASRENNKCCCFLIRRKNMQTAFDSLRPSSRFPLIQQLKILISSRV
jgi:uncharacterized protein (UPF0297 family)